MVINENKPQPLAAYSAFLVYFMADTTPNWEKIYKMFQKELYNFERLYIYEDIRVYSVFNCHNAAKHAEYYLG
jgi:hypothetical protein